MREEQPPVDENARVDALRRYGILDTPREEAYDDLASLAAQVCGTPLAMIGFLDTDRVWFKSTVGFDATEMPRDRTFCAHAVVVREVLVVPDAAADPRFSSNPLVTSAPGVRFYAGVPLFSREGYALGTLCVVDRVGREILPAQLSALRALARQVTAQLELRRRLTELAQAVSDRTRAQEELDLMFTLSIDMLCVAGFDGYYKRLNPAWEKTLGYSKEELFAKPYVEFVHPEDREITLKEGEKLALGRDVIFFENRYICRDGSYRWLAWTATPWKEQQLIFAAARDITERKRAEEDLRRTARELEAARKAEEDNTARLGQLVRELESSRLRAEEATSAKSEFLANMSHEIRTPLNAIVGMTDLALQTRLNTEQREYLNVIRDSTDSLLALVNDLLDFSKIEARKLELERAEFNLHDVLDDTLRILSFRAHEKDLELISDIEMEIPELLIGDSARLRQVLMNIVGNAIKFTEQGEVILEVGLDSLATDKTQLRFSVSDTGIGIPAGNGMTIFQAFSQADSSTTRRFGGTGLGLAIASQLVGLMGGRIWYESTVGKGTTFHFTARFDLPERPASSAAPKYSRLLEGIRALIADKSPTNRRILSEVLSQWRMKPSTVSGGLQALAAMKGAAAAGAAFPLAIIDMRMPGLDGLALAGRMRRSPKLAKTRIILLTTANRSVDYAAARRLGIDARLRKPVKRSELLNSLIRLVSPQTGETAISLHAAAAGRSARRLRILLVEDNPVNQRVAVRLMERRGHEVVVASDGAEALSKLDRAVDHKFDVVLMDVQMPVMGGYEATAAIRARERTTGAHLPIVAMTAGATKEERESCLRAGMDAHLTKPVRSETLYRVVESFGRASAAAVPGARGGIDAGGSLNEAALMAHVGGDQQLLRELVDLFLEDLPERLAAVRKAVRKRDALALSSAAHALKGAVSHFAARDTSEFALKLERMGRTGDLDGAEEAFDGLKSEIGRLTRALAAYRRRIRPRRNNRPGRARTAGRGVARATSRSSQKTEARSPVRGRARRGTERRGK